MKISFVIPVYNEEENIPILYEELKGLINSAAIESEIIFIDDGSTDNSLDIIKSIKREDQTVEVLSFEKNYGQSSALKVGFDRASGDIVVTMDSDLQNDPTEILKLLPYLEKGYDVVSGWRKNRADSFKKKFASKIANSIRNKIIKDDIKDTGCMLKVYRRDVLAKIEMFRGFHRFLPSLLKLHGASVIEVEVNHRKRKFGKSKYGIKNRMLKSLVDTFIVLWMKKNYIKPHIKEEL
ncbi:MAG: glycosyltransferase family 2 protein [Candidatus Kaelpia aquatica]|nr:glycosyltransferase family 2 protein [Candidatus Kaelpia aquatica]